MAEITEVATFLHDVIATGDWIIADCEKRGKIRAILVIELGPNLGLPHCLIVAIGVPLDHEQVVRPLLADTLDREAGKFFTVDEAAVPVIPASLKSHVNQHDSL